MGSASYTVKDEIPKWKVQTNEWNVEDTGKWVTADTDDFFYEIEEKKWRELELKKFGIDVFKVWRTHGTK